MDRSEMARWAFIAGLVLAVIIALVTPLHSAFLWLMILLGLFAGYVFVTEDMEHHFILVAIGLVFFSQTLSELPSVGEPVTALLVSVSTYFGVMIVALAVRNIITWVTASPRGNKRV